MIAQALHEQYRGTGIALNEDCGHCPDFVCAVTVGCRYCRQELCAGGFEEHYCVADALAAPARRCIHCTEPVDGTMVELAGRREAHARCVWGKR